MREILFDKKFKASYVFKKLAYKIGVALGVTEVSDYPIPNYSVGKYTSPLTEDVSGSRPEVNSFPVILKK